MLEGYFRLKEHGTTVGTEVVAGLTTFMVMAYIIFVNPAILSFAGIPPLQAQGVPFAPTLAATCLVAALATAAMGLVTNYPLAVASGMGLNAVVAFQLIAAQKLPWPAAMGVIFLEGVAHHHPRAGRRAGGGRERHPPRAEAGHLGRDRPLHPLHRAGERRPRPARPGHPGDARRRDEPEGPGRRGGPVPDAPLPGARCPRGAAPRDPRHDHPGDLRQHAPRRRRVDDAGGGRGADVARGLAGLLDARRRPQLRGLRPAGRPRRLSRDLLDHAVGFLRHDGHGDRDRGARRGGSTRRGACRA